MAIYPQDEADFIAGLTDASFTSGGHRTNFIPSLESALALAAFTKDSAVEISALADQVAADAASAAAGSGTEASIGDIRAGTSAHYLSIRRLYQAMAPVALADAASIALDLSAGINFAVTLGGDRTLANPTNAIAGQSGFVVTTQDATGGRTLTKESNWKVSGGTIYLDPGAGAKSILSYVVESPTSILATVSEAFS